MITIITGVRNISFRTARRFIESIRQQAEPHKLIVVDYGSDMRHLGWYRRLFGESLIEVTRHTEIWSESRALNIGIRHADTDYVCTTNGDLIFSPNFFAEVVRALESSPNALVICDRIDLDSSGAEVGKVPQCYFGTCLGAARSRFMEMRGFDEVYQGWGRLDMDFVYRARDHGMNWVNIGDRTRVWHQYHLHRRSVGGTDNKEAYDAAYERNEQYYRNEARGVVRNPNGWGEL